MECRGVRFLVPASERKNGGGSPLFSYKEAQTDRGSNRFPSLTNQRKEVIVAFQHALNGAGHGPQVLRLRGGVLETAVEQNLDMMIAPTLTVLEREAGPLFQALQAPVLKGRALQRVRDEVLVVCPLLGLLGVRDLVPNYRCPIGAQIPGFGGVHAYWKERLGALATRLCRGRRVYSFLPGRLLSLFQPLDPAAELVTFHFERRGKDGTIHPDTAGAGSVSGQILRHILERPVEDPSALSRLKTALGHRLHAIVDKGERAREFVWRR